MEEADRDIWWPRWVWVGECFFWYRLTQVVPDKIQRAVKQLCVCVCVWHCLNLQETVDNSNQKETQVSRQLLIPGNCQAEMFHLAAEKLDTKFRNTTTTNQTPKLINLPKQIRELILITNRAALVHRVLLRMQTILIHTHLPGESLCFRIYWTGAL